MAELLPYASFLLAVLGMIWLALAMKAHWSQVRRNAPHTRETARRLRVMGASALSLSLAASLGADHGSIALLVWIMTLSAAAVIVAMILAYRPRWFAWFLRRAP